MHPNCDAGTAETGAATASPCTEPSRRSARRRGGIRRARTNNRSAHCARRTRRRAADDCSFSSTSFAISAKRGAAATISLLMPVKLSMYEGMRHSGFTSELHSSTRHAFLDPHDADFGDAMIGGVAAGRLQVDEYQILRKPGRLSRTGGSLSRLRSLSRVRCFSRVHRAIGGGSTDRGADRGTRPRPGGSGARPPNRMWRSARFR